MPGVGFGLGDVTLKDFLEVHGLLPNFKTPENDLFISYQTEKAETEAIKLANNLRDKGLRVVVHFGELKFKKIFGLAEKKGAKAAALIGEDELKQQKVQIKNLSSRDQQEYSLADIDAIYSNLK